ncbi:MAG: hypothetical protein EZS26_002090 [Candidatus Ordinivivax streblomastigis]|uniref:RiboL-PSP-HEPN domain-containing protein n=1 Tax=Candidatus Ordinivivax streblomastigis TaxID=2540710 RepID=A0A5M8P050_9BACT|nr:MAG: hypothetical protein EZS26_002090 [Candidatus Ordinivivax streblomastigis]
MKIKGRSENQSLIEDNINVFERMLSEIVEYLSEQSNTLNKTITDIVKDGSAGDKDIEQTIYHSLSPFLDEYNLIDNCFSEGLVLSSYSFYERMLKQIAKSNKIVKQKDLPKSYAINYIDAIKQHLKISKFEENIETSITEIDSRYRSLRIDITHKEYTGFHKIDFFYIKESLDKIKEILLTINKAIETK